MTELINEQKLAPWLRLISPLLLLLLMFILNDVRVGQEVSQADIKEIRSAQGDIKARLSGIETSIDIYHGSGYISGD